MLHRNKHQRETLKGSLDMNNWYSELDEQERQERGEERRQEEVQTEATGRCEVGGCHGRVPGFKGGPQESTR